MLRAVALKLVENFLPAINTLRNFIFTPSELMEVSCYTDRLKNDNYAQTYYT